MSLLISRIILATAVLRAALGKGPLPYSSDGECNNATSEYYVKNLKICCSKCKPGTRRDVSCTENSDTVCAPCSDGQYSETFNHHPNCFSCTLCKDEKGLAYGTKCSANTKSVCVCKPGRFCSRLTFSGCEECKKYRVCKPGQQISKTGSQNADVQCEACPSGTFSNHSNAELCQQHTQCDADSILKPGNSTADTLCVMTSVPSTKTEVSSKHPHPRFVIGFRNQTEEAKRDTTTTPSLLPSSSMMPTTTANKTRSGSDSETQALIYSTVIVCGVLVLLILILAVMMIACKLRKRKAPLPKVPIPADNKLDQDPSESVIPDNQHLLATDKCQKEPSMSSSDSQSQPDSSQSHSSSDWLERGSQEESLLELPSVSSPLVNLSITATFNCQLNPATASCSIPLSPSALTPHVEAPVPLSQEETDSCGNTVQFSLPEHPLHRCCWSTTSTKVV